MPLVHHVEPSQEKPSNTRYFHDRVQEASPASSAQSFTSTLADEEELDEEPVPYQIPDDADRHREASSAIAATPSDFSELFPSNRKMLIHHDDSTDDGNMNLRIDTKVSIEGQRLDMTLFHLRLQELRTREFSLRRYCRDSGREVCHSTNKQQDKTNQKRPGFSRSLSNALNNMRSPSGQKTPTASSLSRNDSGYGSVQSGDFNDGHSSLSPDNNTKPQEPVATDTIRLEFSNYAQASVKRVGTKGNKRYDFEYWNVHYTWRRAVQRENGITRVSYHLTKAGSDAKLAYIAPVELDAEQREAEEERGGWVPPCRMWIADSGILRAQKDLSDVVVAAGLVALVDDSIRARLESQKAKLGVEYIGPKRLINEMFSRTNSGSKTETRPTASRQSSRPSTSGAGSNGSRVVSGELH